MSCGRCWSTPPAPIRCRVGVDADVPIYAAAPAVLQRITGLGVHRGLLACFDRRPPRPPPRCWPLVQVTGVI